MKEMLMRGLALLLVFLCGIQDGDIHRPDLILHNKSEEVQPSEDLVPAVYYPSAVTAYLVQFEAAQPGSANSPKPLRIVDLRKRKTIPAAEWQKVLAGGDYRTEVLPFDPYRRFQAGTIRLDGTIQKAEY